MRLIRWSVALAVLAFSLGCHDTSGPPGFPANYMLVSVNGRPLPAIVSPIPESPTVLDGTAFLDGSGNAVIREHELVMIAPGDVTYSTAYAYTIKNSSIHFRPQCVVLAGSGSCFTEPVGTFVGTHLVVDMSGDGSGPVYDFQLAHTD